VAVQKFHVLQRKNKYTDKDSDHEAFQAFVLDQISLETNEGGPTDDRAAFFNLLGMASLLYHEHDCAKQQFEQASKADPELGVPELNLALLALVEKRFDEAVQRALAAEQAREMRGEPFLVANARAVIGLALWGKGDLHGAATQFHTAVDIYPSSMWGYFYWSELMASLGNKDSAALLAGRAEHNLQFFESYSEVALMYARVDPTADFRFSRVDILRARHLSDLEPSRSEESEQDEIIAAPHTCPKL